jgi:hypothetical protein
MRACAAALTTSRRVLDASGVSSFIPSRGFGTTAKAPAASAWTVVSAPRAVSVEQITPASAAPP